MRIFRIFSLIVLTGCFLAAPPALACKCIEPELTAETAASFPYIFTATSRKAVTHVGEKYIETTILRVQKNFKGGAAGDLMPLHYQGGCAFHFEEGKTYLVFAEISGHIHLQASVCSPTRAIEDSNDIPAFLREINAAEPAAVPAEE